MAYLCSYQCLWLYFILGQFNTLHIRADWPSPSSSRVQLLGLFHDTPNGSKPLTSSVHSRAMFKSAVMLSQQYQVRVNGEVLGWRAIDTTDDVMDTMRNVCVVVSASNIVGIVGPGLSKEASVIALFAGTLGIPAISYSATSYDLSDRNIYSTFYRTVPADSTGALAIAQLFIRFNWTSCVIVYQNDAFGTNGAKAISEAFHRYNLTVTQTISFNIEMHRIQGDLKQLLTSSPTRLVILWAQEDLAVLVVQNALDVDVFGPHFTWVLSANIPLSSFDEKWRPKLVGMLLMEPAVGSAVNAPTNTSLLTKSYRMWQKYELDSFPGPDKVHSYAIFAFDAAWLLIQSLARLCSTSTPNSSPCISIEASALCFDRRLRNASAFFREVDTTTLLGVSGPVQFGRNTTDRVSGSYYILKNVQHSAAGLRYVPVLVWSSSAVWTVATHGSTIIWPGSILVPPSGTPSAFGVTFRIIVFEVPPFTMKTEVIGHSGTKTTKLVGYLPDLIEHLQKKMGFTPQITMASSNLTYNQLVNAVANNEYDMVVADLIITAARREKVGFSTSIFDTSLRLIIRDESTTRLELLGYLKPFSRSLWFILLGAVIYAGLLIILFEGRENEALRDRSIVSKIAMSMWYSLGTIMGFGIDFNVSTAAGRLLTVGLSILSLILVAAYTANLASDLTVKKAKGLLSGIDDIKNGKVAFSRLGIPIDSAIEDYYLREVSSGSRNFYPLPTMSAAYSSLLDRTIDAAILDIGLSEYATNFLYCDLTLIGADFGRSTYGIAFQKNWIYAKDLDVSLLRLREAGVFEELKRKWFEGKVCSDVFETSTAMGIESMAGLFLTFAVISVLSVTLFAWLKGRRMRKHRKNKSTRRISKVRRQTSKVDELISSA